jgi:Cdc6-like AAA superfamily ATPase
MEEGTAHPPSAEAAEPLARDDPVGPKERNNLWVQASQVFSPSAPIDEAALFAGRNAQVGQVIGAIVQPGQHAIIFGERGVGKTSLANVLSEMLEDRQRAVAAPRVNCDGADSFDSLWRKVFAEIEFFARTKPMGFGSADEFKKIAATKLLPDTELSPDHIRRALEVLSPYAVLVLIIDEFDRLANPQDRKLLADTIKTLSDHAVRATVVLVGVADAVDSLIADHQSIERGLVQIQMPRMSTEELESIIRNGTERLRFFVDEDAVRHITLLSQGLPHYTHLLGLFAVREAIDNQRRYITLADAEAAIEEALKQAQQSIRSAYHKATSSPHKDNLFATVLLASALAEPDDLGFFPAAAVRPPIRLITGKDYDIPSYSRHLNDFCEADRGPVLQKTGKKHSFRFRFLNPLMQPFVTMQGFADERLTREHLEQLFESRQVREKATTSRSRRERGGGKEG